MGSNMAEAHPVGFQWVVEARERGAKVIHVDPRFTRTSALATSYVRLRAGTDIAFLGGIIKYILEHGRDFREYVTAYTNAPVIIDEDFRDTEDLDGFFSGWKEGGGYDTTSWQYDGMEVHSSGGERELGATVGEQAGHGGQGATLKEGEPPREDATLRAPALRLPAPEAALPTLHPRAGRGGLRRAARAVPRGLRGALRELRPRADVGDRLLGRLDAAHRRRPVHPRGRDHPAAARQHRPARRRHHGAARARLDPGLDRHPDALQHPARLHPDAAREAARELARFIELTESPTGFWGHIEAYTVSLLKAYWGASATAENDFCFDYLPRISGDHETYQTALEMLDGKVPGFIVVGENPVVGSANGSLQRRALAKAKWLVVRDLVEIETASFWYDSPEIESGDLATDEIGTEVFFLPAASHVEKDGSFTNTQRLLQWRHKAVEPPGDCRSDLWFYFHLGPDHPREARGPGPRRRP